MKKIRIMLIGDLVGAPGCAMVEKYLPRLKDLYKIDGVIVNGENTAEGRGITPKIMAFLKKIGVNVVTTGNHIWHQKDIYEYLKKNDDLIRPANFPSDCPGSGSTFFTVAGTVVGVLNLQGRVFMRELLACPFKTADSLLTYVRSKTSCIVVDMHAETTAEKMAIGFYLDGRVTAVVGTHTHVPTADERILPKGTAFVTDLGMVGARNSMIGMKKDPIIHNFLTQMPVKFSVETEGPFVLSGVWIELDAQSGKALAIERIQIVDTELML